MTAHRNKSFSTIYSTLANLILKRVGSFRPAFICLTNQKKNPSGSLTGKAGIKRVTKKRRLDGFTLIELLIVIVIISIVTTFGVLSLKVNEKKRLETLTHQIVNTLTLAEQEALLRPATLGVALIKNNLHFYIHQPSIDAEKSPWQPLSDSILNSMHIPNDMSMTLKIDGKIITSGQPEIIITPGGDMTSFQLLLGKKNASPIYQIIGEENGNLTSVRIDSED